ncbi:hypothetical protein ON010_g3595 [Phytophthora cinnamomi]|nr:hypothetical protein ON010_g3595 [Phytophthora cinnamomi]
MKRIKARHGGVHTIKLNNVLELGYCVYPGSDWCLISRKNFEELARLCTGVQVETLQRPAVGKVIDGHDVEALEQPAGNRLELDDDPFVTEDDARSGLSDEADTCAGVELLIDAALENGFPVQFVDELRCIALKHNIWRLILRDDLPANVPPYKLQLEDNAQQFRCKMCQWACAALPLRKPKTDGSRRVINYKPLNAMTEAIAGLMPNLKTTLETVRGKKQYGLFDFIRSFWQLAVAEESREMLSYMTDEGVFTPTRVMQGSCDSALHFQVSMENCVAELLHEYLLIWIDDLLLFADTIAEHLSVLEKLFDLVHQFGLKLSLKKPSLYQQSVTWCGKIFDQNGIRHDPKRIEGLTAMPQPRKVGQLPQFICATNWMRDSLIDYARVVQPLQQCLDVALKGKCKTNQVKTLLQQSAQLAYPHHGATLCLFVDANNEGWASILSQVAVRKSGVTVTDQAHELLICKRGTFHGAQNIGGDPKGSRWGGSSTATTAAFKRVTRLQARAQCRPLLRPLDQDGFTWSTLTEIAATQAAYAGSAPTGGTRDGNNVLWCGGTI